MKTITEVFKTLTQTSVDYSVGVGNISKKYFSISDNIFVNEYVNSEYANFQYAINIAIPNVKNTFIPFFHIELKPGNNSSHIARQRFLDIRKNREIEYNFAHLIEDAKIDRLQLHVDNKGGTSIISKDFDDKLKNELEKKLNKPTSFSSIIWADERLFNKPVDLFFEIRNIDYSFEGKYVSNILVTSSDINLISIFFKEKTRTLQNVIDLIKSKYSYDVNAYVKYEATKSAKAAIMSRNMSHNLGSHVMAYLKQHLNSVQDMIKDNVLSQLFVSDESLERIVSDPCSWLNNVQQRISNDETSQDKGVQPNANDIKELALPFLVGLGRFISYLQERQDFIATIATDFTPYLSNVNFKDFVYDELNPDLRFDRHKDRKGMKPDNILLGNIARSEGLGRSTMPTTGKALNEINLNFRDFDGRPIPDNTPKDQRPKGLEEMRDYFFSLPGGVVGRQAIFSIVENIIRNAAKHGNWREIGNLTLTFDIYQKADIDRASGTDNIDKHMSLKGVFEKFYLSAKDSDDLYFVTLTDNLNFSEAALAKLRKALIEPYIDETGEMVNANKGIKEMRISAAWLRSLNDGMEINPVIAESDHELWREDKWTGAAPVLYARISKDGQGKHLQYIFCVLRPKKVAIISGQAVSEQTQKRFTAASWQIFTPEQFKVERNKSFEFILLDKELADKYEELRRICPNRLYLTSVISSDFMVHLDRVNCAEVETKLYQRLAGNDDRSAITISDDKTLAKYSSDNCPISLLNGKVVVGGGFTGQFLYRKHYESYSDFRACMDDILNKGLSCDFVEGITGNNSTDRLIRNEPIDQLWMYRHLHAMKTKVAIFDERIFSKIFKCDEADLVKATTGISIPPCPEGRDEKDYVEEQKKSLRTSYSEIRRPANSSVLKKIHTVDDLNKYIASHEAIFGTPNADKSISADYMAIAYAMKGVRVFTIIVSDSGFDIFGYSGLERDANGDYKSVCKCIATIQYSENGGFKIDRTDDGDRFDYMTIHQGLLDKIYDKFEIKDDSQKKHEFTKAFYQIFTTEPYEKTIISYEDKDNQDNQLTGYFLPGMCIHSGRSKPSEVDMPQKLPFIQYAAIEHAVMDCKYSLVELLDFARYE